MFSSLKLPTLRGRKQGEEDHHLANGPLHLDLTSPPSKRQPHPIVTTTRRSHKWSIDRALCPGIGDKREDKSKMPSITEIEHNKLENIDVNSSIHHNNDWDTESFNGEHSNGVEVVTRLMNVSIERDSNGSLGITLRGGAHPDPALSRPLTITQVKSGGPADREGSIKVGDRLVSVDGHSLASVSLTDAQNVLKSSTSPVSVLCVEYDVSVMRGVRAAQGPLLVEIDGPHTHSLGVELINTPDHAAVVIGHVKTGSIAERCGALLPGDQILAVNDVCVEDTKMTAEDVSQLLWTGNSCVLKILPSSSSSYRGFPQPLYSCPSPSQISKHSRDHQHSKNDVPLIKTQSPFLKRQHTSNSSIHESDVEANSTGVYQRKSLSISLNCDSQNNYGITVGPDPYRLGTCITAIESKSPAERCGSLQVGDRVIAINDAPPPDLTVAQSLRFLVPGPSVTLTIEFTVAQTVLPTSGVFTVKLANNKVAGLGITISGCSQYEGSMVISHIRPGSVAHRCGTLAQGDSILAVNGHSLAGCTLDQASAILHSQQDIVTLVVQKATDEYREEGYNSVHTVEFCRGGGPLGITIAGSEDPYEPIVVSALTTDGLAEQSQALRVGDRLLAIDSRSVAHEPLSTAIYLLQHSRDRVVLCVGRNNPPISVNSSVAREDLMGYSSPEIPSIDSAVESWDSLHEQSPPAVQPSLQVYKPESATVRRKLPLQSCDPPVLACTRADLHSTNSLNTMQSDADTCSSLRLSESVLHDYTTQLIAQQKCAPPSPPCPLQVNYQYRNNTLPNHRRSSSIGLMRYHESVQANLISSPRRCRRGFHLLEDEAANFPLSEDLEINHPEITFDTFFKRVTGPEREPPEDSSKNIRHVFQVTLYKDPVYEDFGFSVSDGLYERGVYINRIRRGGPADTSRMLQPYDRILQVNETKTEDLDCCLTVPLVASAGEKLQLTVCRGSYQRALDPQDHNSSSIPWMEEEEKESEPLLLHKAQTITKTL